MATRKITISADEAVLAYIEQAAKGAGMALSPFMAQSARNWVLFEDAQRLAAYDHSLGRDNPELAEAELALHHEAEADAEVHRGHGHAA